MSSLHTFLYAVTLRNQGTLACFKVPQDALMSHYYLLPYITCLSLISRPQVTFLSMFGKYLPFEQACLYSCAERLECKFCCHRSKIVQLSAQGAEELDLLPLTTFKRELDRFLKTVPDEPRVRGYTQYCRAESNSLTHMVRLRNVGTMTGSGRTTATE